MPNPVSDRGLVLVIDDEPELASIIRELLLTLGFRVITALNPEEGRASFALLSDQLALVLCDVNLGGGESGVRLFEEFTAAKPRLPVVLMSGDPEAPLPREAYPVLPKPFDLAELIAVINEALEQRS